MTTLYQKSSLGKIKFIELTTDGSKLIAKWGLLGGKTQTTTKECIGLNVGKSNETTPAQQAILEMDAKVLKKKKEGYSEDKPTEQELKENQDPEALDLDNLPRNFCPSKPISQAKMPDKIRNAENSYAQRKHNGHCLILARGSKPTKVYTRRMEDITQYVKDLPVIKEAMDKLPEGSFILHECVYYSKTYQKEMPRFVAQVITKEDAVEALRRYVELSKIGTYSMIPLDALFLNYKYLGNVSHQDRVKALRTNDIETPGFISNWKDFSEKARGMNWEGFVIRVPGKESFIGYSMDGKPKRMGCWKEKFLSDPEDFVVDQVLKGESGKHSEFYAKFHIFQYDSEGNKVDRGFVGPGTLSHEQLKELTENIDNKKQKIPFVVEIEYQSIHDESKKLEFGQIQRLRPDKSPEECLAED